MFIGKKVLAIIVLVGILLGGMAVYGFVSKNKQTDLSENTEKENIKELSGENTLAEIAVVASSTAESSSTISVKPGADTKPVAKKFTTAISFDPNIPYQFSIPEGYSFGPDIGATVVTKKDGVGKEKVVFAVSAMPDETAKNTEEYIQNKVKSSGYIKTGETRIIGGYKAYRLKNPKNANEVVYAFLTNYKFSLQAFGGAEPVDPVVSSQLSEMKYGIVFISNLNEVPQGKEVEELIFSSFTFLN